MIDRNQRYAPRQRHRLAERQPHHHRTHQPRPGGGRDRGDLAEVDARLAERLTGHGLDHLHMGPGGDLRHHPAERRVRRHLARHHRRQHFGAAALVQAHHRGGGLIAARFQAEDEGGRGHS
jgi:hypothetical protein